MGIPRNRIEINLHGSQCQSCLFRSTRLRVRDVAFLMVNVFFLEERLKLTKPFQAENPHLRIFTLYLLRDPRASLADIKVFYAKKSLANTKVFMSQKVLLISMFFMPKSLAVINVFMPKSLADINVFMQQKQSC